MAKKPIKTMCYLLNVNAQQMRGKLHQMDSTLLEVRKVLHPKGNQVLQLVYSAKQKEIQLLRIQRKDVIHHLQNQRKLEVSLHLVKNNQP